MEKQTKSLWVLLLGVFILCGGIVNAQTPTYYCDIRNESFVSSNTFEFDVFITRTGTTALELACFNSGIKLNGAFVNGGLITPELVAGSELLPSQIPTSIAFDAAQNCVKIAPKTPPRNYATGVTTGTVISNTVGTKICRVRLNNSVDFGADPANYTWNLTPVPYSTIVSAFLAGASPLVNSVITTATSQSVSGNLTLFLEGLFASGSNNKVMDDIGYHFGGPIADQVTIKLVNAATHSVDFTSHPANLYTNGKCSYSLPASISGSYYIVVNHRNSIETWSASPVVFGSGTVAYNFTDDAAKAFGSNMIEKAPGTWALYGGDVNQDGIVDSGDMNPVENESTAVTMGYVVEDVNGDGIVDSSDMNLVENNSTAVIMVQPPF